MLTKKMTTIILGSVAGSAGVVGGVVAGVAANPEVISNSAIVDTDIINDASVQDIVIYEKEIIISEASNEQLDSAINKYVDEIIASLNGQNVNIEYKQGSAIYKSGSIPMAEFIATPVEKHAWSDGSLGSKTIKITFINVNVVPIIYSDAEAPTMDIFNLKVSLSRKSDLELNNFLSNLNLNILNFANYAEYGMHYKNVELSYVENSANVDTKTFNIRVYPTVKHEWVTGGDMQKIITVSINDLVIVSATAPNESNYVSTIELLKSNDELLNEHLMQIDFNNSKLLENTTDFNNVDLKYIQNSANVNEQTFSLTATPLEGHEWTTGGNYTKNIKVTINKLVINSAFIYSDSMMARDIFIDYANSTDLNRVLSQMDFAGGFRILLTNGNQFKNVNISYVNNSANFEQNYFLLSATPTSGFYWDDGTTSSRYIKVNIPANRLKLYMSVPSRTEIDLWYNKIFAQENNKTYLECVFSPENIDLLFKTIDSKFYGLHTISYINTSMKLHSNDTKADITVNVELKQVSSKYTLVWLDGSTSGTKQMIVTVGGFRFVK